MRWCARPHRYTRSWPNQDMNAVDMLLVSGIACSSITMTSVKVSEPMILGEAPRPCNYDSREHARTETTPRIALSSPSTGRWRRSKSKTSASFKTRRASSSHTRDSGVRLVLEPSRAWNAATPRGKTS